MNRQPSGAAVMQAAAVAQIIQNLSAQSRVANKFVPDTYGAPAEFNPDTRRA